MLQEQLVGRPAVQLHACCAWFKWRVVSRLCLLAIG